MAPEKQTENKFSEENKPISMNMTGLINSQNLDEKDKISFLEDVLALIEISKNFFFLRAFLISPTTTPKEISNIIKKDHISPIWGDLLNDRDIVIRILYESFINILNIRTLNSEEFNYPTLTNRFYGYKFNTLFYMIKLQPILQIHDQETCSQTSSSSREKHNSLSQGSEKTPQQVKSILTEEDEFDPKETPLFSDSMQEPFESSLHSSTTSISHNYDCKEYESDSEDEVIRYAHSPEEFLIIAKNDLILYENSSRNSISYEESSSRDTIEKKSIHSFEQTKSIEKIDEFKKLALNLLNNSDSLRDVEKALYLQQRQAKDDVIKHINVAGLLEEIILYKFNKLLENWQEKLNISEEEFSEIIKEITLENIFYLLKNIKNLQYRSDSETESSEQSNSSKKRKISSQPEDLETNYSAENKRYKTESTTDIPSYHTSQVLNVPLNQAEFD